MEFFCPLTIPLLPFFLLEPCHFCILNKAKDCLFPPLQHRKCRNSTFFQEKTCGHADFVLNLHSQFGNKHTKFPKALNDSGCGAVGQRTRLGGVWSLVRVQSPRHQSKGNDSQYLLLVSLPFFVCLSDKRKDGNPTNYALFCTFLPHFALNLPPYCHRMSFD